MTLTYVDHIAIETVNVASSVSWYKNKFNCTVKFQDDSWALIGFRNISLALVTPGEHPPHFAVVDESVLNNGEKKKHRDGIYYIYEKDVDNNVIEKIHRKS